jgi:hypothetical protein
LSGHDGHASTKRRVDLVAKGGGVERRAKHDETRGTKFFEHYNLDFRWSPTRSAFAMMPESKYFFGGCNQMEARP